MNAAVDQPANQDIAALMQSLGRAAVGASEALARANTATKDRALGAIAVALRARVPELLAANARDMEAARAKGATGAMLDRLALDEKRIEAMARGVEDIAALADPIGATVAAMDAAQWAATSRACACRWASSASSTRAAPT